MAVNSFSISSAECEHGFSQINLLSELHLCAHIHHFIFTFFESCWTHLSEVMGGQRTQNCHRYTQ